MHSLLGQTLNVYSKFDLQKISWTIRQWLKTLS